MRAKMKKIFTVILLCLAANLSYADNSGKLSERVYVTSDKSVYVAGDQVWLSAWCVDVEGNKSSEFSKTAYIELHSAEGMVQRGKIALDKGRGAGTLKLLSTLHSGNYSIIAYTARNTREDSYKYDFACRNISIINTLSTERVSGNVEIGTVQESYSANASNGISIRCTEQAASNSQMPLTITNNSDKTAQISVSVFHEDGIPAPQNIGAAGFVQAARGSVGSSSGLTDAIPDYEGEIIRAHVSGAPQAREFAAGKKVFLSVPGQLNVYTSVIDNEGQAAFYTTNICGSNDMVLEIEGLEEGQTCHMEIDSPFVGPKLNIDSKLTLDPSWEDKLKARSMGMQIEKIFEADTIYNYLPANKHNPFGKSGAKYILDDYTRFPLMSEIMTEFVQEARVRTISGKRFIQVRVEDIFKEVHYKQGLSLVMLDGVPIMDHEKILQYDPLLVKYLEIFPRTIHLGSQSFMGAINFVTYKGNLSSMKFEDNVRIISGLGTSTPMSFTCENVSSDYPDYRQTVYWHPLISIAPGESIEIKCKTPAYSGRFAINVEGFDENLKPVNACSSFELR